MCPGCISPAWLQWRSMLIWRYIDSMHTKFYMLLNINRVYCIYKYEINHFNKHYNHILKIQCISFLNTLNSIKYHVMYVFQYICFKTPCWSKIWSTSNIWYVHGCFSVNVSKPLVGAKYKVQLINVVYLYFFPQGSATVSDI